MFQGTGFAPASTSSPFGQSGFGKPATPGFNPPVFGSSTGTSLFGGATTQQSVLFGGNTSTPAFGPAQTTQPTFASGGTTGLFGGQASTANTGGGLFGSNTTSAFGQTKPNAFSGFGSSGVGQTATPTAQPGASSLFGQSQTQSATGLFGTNTGFSAGGTTVKFTPITGTDSLVKNGVTTSINTRHHCITCMKEYENKSLEELRLEDYAANRRGPRQGAQTGTVFGTTGQMSLFGAGTSTAGTSNLFGTTAENKPLLGSATNTGFGTSGGTVFGSTSTNLFGKPAGTATAFGAPTSTTAGTFGFNTTANAANPFGANTAQKPFGAAAPTGLFGATSQQSTGFGTNTSGFGNFGNTQTNLFGEQKATFGIGTNTGFSITQPTSTSTTSLFGGQKPALGSGFGTGAFGQPATTSTAPTGFGTPFGQPQQSTGLLGGAAGGLKTTSTGFSFGQSTNTLGGTSLALGSGGSSIFGQPAQKPGGLFGSTNMGGTSLFGGTNMNTFGTSTMFNTGSNTLGAGGTTGGLGSSGGLGTLGTLGGGGLNQTNQLGSGAVPAQFVNPIHQHLSIFTALPYGDSPVFKNILKGSSGGKADELLKPTSPAAQKALLSGQNYKVISKPTSKLKIKPIETINLTKKALFEELDAEEEMISNTRNTEQWPVVSRRRLMIKPTVSYLTGDSSISPLLSSLQKKVSLNNSENSPNSHLANSNPDDYSIAPPLRHSTSFFSSSPHQRTPTSSKPQSHLKIGQVDNAGTHMDPHSPVASTSLQKKVLFKSVDSDNSQGNSSDLRTKDAKETADQSTTSSSDSDQEESIPAELDNSSVGSQHPTGISLRRPGYYTIPTLEELASLMDEQGRCIVDNFTIGRLNYGNIFYPDSFDVSGLNLDEIVHFRHKEVTVYPDDSIKPPVGEGLNRRAQVTLDRVWPVDKTTRIPITDPARILAMDYENKLSRACAKHGTHYVEYRPTTGSWVFKVEHFSKYGLTDSDDDETVGVDIKKIKLGIVGATDGVAVNGNAAVSLLHHQQQSVPQLQIPSKQVEDALTALMAEEDEDMDDGITNPFDLDEELERRTLSPTAKLARQSGTNARKLQMMKASFFDKTSFNIDGECLELGDVVENTNEIVEDGINDMRINSSFKRLTDTLSWYHRQGAADLLNMSHLGEVADLKERSSSKDDLMGLERITEEDRLQISIAGPDTVVKQSTDLQDKIFPCSRPKIYELHYLGFGEVNKTGFGTLQTEAKLSTKYIADMGYFKRFSFKIGTGPRNQYITLASTDKNSQEGINSKNPLLSSDFASLRIINPSSIDAVSLDKQYQPRFEDCIKFHLEAALTESIIENTNVGPKISPRPGTAGLEAHHSIASNMPTDVEDKHFILAKTVFGLMRALWAELDGMKGCAAGADDHACLMLRKNAVSEWLESALTGSITKRAESSKGPGAVFAYMTGIKLAEACETARDIHDIQLSLLISQSGGSRTVRELVHRQLIQWRETEADRHINIDRLKCYLLIAGLPIYQASNVCVNTCEHLDWLTSFAVHFWYVTSVCSTVTDALLAYDEAYKGKNGYAVPPLPGYSKYYDIEVIKSLGYGKTTTGQCYDILYHLLHLYSEKSYALEQLLNPATHTTDLLDYRIVWLVMRMLSALGYSHLSENAAAIVHSSFAEQLESYGLWEWAVFVLLHLSNDLRRESSVKQVIERFVSAEEHCPKETFLIQRLSIPSSWIYEAKATKAMYFKRYEDAANYLIKAGKWNECHQLIMEHIASKAIVNERYNYLEDLLSQLAERSHLITGWSSGGGGTVLEYLRIVRKVDELVAARDPNSLAYQLEEMQPQLTNLCRNIKLVPSKTPMNRLAQCEMSKRTADLLQHLIIGSTTDQENEEEDAMNFSGSVDALAALIAELPLPSDYKLNQWLGVGNLWKRCAATVTTGN